MTTWKTYSKKVSKRSNYKSKEAFRSIHMGVYNSIHLNSFVKNKSIFFFINNFSRKFWVYFLKKKFEFEVFSTFNKFKVLVEKKWPKYRSNEIQ